MRVTTAINRNMSDFLDRSPNPEDNPVDWKLLDYTTDLMKENEKLKQIRQ